MFWVYSFEKIVFVLAWSRTRLVVQSERQPIANNEARQCILSVSSCILSDKPLFLLYFFVYSRVFSQTYSSSRGRRVICRHQDTHKIHTEYTQNTYKIHVMFTHLIVISPLAQYTEYTQNTHSIRSYWTLSGAKQ